MVGYRKGDLLMRKFWRIWAKALGEKTGKTDQEADAVALVRTLIVLLYLLTNTLIMAGIFKHWND